MTMNREDLKAFIDGELSAKDSATIRVEIEQDPALGKEVEFLKLIGDGIRECAVDPPVQGADEILHRFQRTRRPARWPFLALATAVSGIAIAIFVAPIFSQSNSDAAGSTTGAFPEAVAMKSAAPAEAFSKSETQKKFMSNTVPMSANGAGELTSRGGAAAAKSVDSVSKEDRSSSSGQVLLGASGDSNGRVKMAAPRPTTTDSVGSSSQWYQPQDASPAPMARADARRMVVQNASLDEVVHDVATAESETTSYVQSIGGFVQNSNLVKGDVDDLPVASMTIRVPARSFAAALNRFKAFAIDRAHIKTLNISGQDVTGDYVDATARLKVMEAEQDSYLTMLKGARNMGQVLELKDRLSSVRQKIESAKSTAETLKDQSALSSVDITYEQEPRPKKTAVPAAVKMGRSWEGQNWDTAVGGLRETLHFLGGIVIFLFVYSPIWLPIGAVGMWLYRRNRWS